MKGFTAANQNLGDLNAETAAKLIEAASDIALIIDADGLICDIAMRNRELSLLLDDYRSWVGRPWIGTVTEESRPRAEALLGEATTEIAAQWRQVYHPSAQHGAIPVSYAAVRLGDEARVVVLGRDLQPIATLQRRLVEAQQAMERDYLRLRLMETRYRVLFEISAEAVVVVDAVTEKISEANPSARELLGYGGNRILGRGFADIFDAQSTPAVQALLAGVRAGGKTDSVTARLARGGREVLASASLIRQESASLFLLQFAPAAQDAAASAMSSAQFSLLKLVENSPDGFVVTGTDRRILTANAAFLAVTQLASEARARGEPLDRWVGRPGADLDILTASLQQHGPVRLFATTLRGEYGVTTEVEISAAALQSGRQPCLGFAIRDIGRRLTATPRSRRELPRSMEQLTELIGRVSLKDLVRETTDVIERLCIETALEITSDNRASAAEMLGLSRQSLYTKLRRYGLSTEAESDGEDQ